MLSERFVSTADGEDPDLSALSLPTLLELLFSEIKPFLIFHCILR